MARPPPPPPASAPNWEVVNAFHKGGSFKDAAAEAEAITALLAAVPLAELFQSISSSAGPKSATVLAVLARVFAPPHGTRFLTEEVTPFIAAGLAPSAHVKIRAATAGILQRLAMAEVADASVAILGSGPLAEALVAAVADSDVGVSGKAAEALVQCFWYLLPASSATAAAAADSAAADSAAADSSLGDLAKGVLARVAAAARDDRYAASASTHLMRFVDLAVRASLASGVVFAAADDSGALGLLVDVVKKDDVLLQMNALELVGKLCRSPPHVAWLFRSGIADWLLVLATGRSAADDELDDKENGGSGGGGEPDPFLGNDALRTLGSMLAGMQTSASGGSFLGGGGLDPKLVLRFLRAVTKAGGDGNERQQVAAMDALSTFAAASEENLDLVLADARLLAAWLTLSANPRHKAFVLHSIAHVIAPRADDNIAAVAAGAGAPITTTSLLPPAASPAAAAATGDAPFNPPPPGGGVGGSASNAEAEAEAEAEARRERLFRTFFECNIAGFGSGVELVMASVRPPVEEVRVAGFDLLRALASTGWGCGALDGYAGLYAFLLNRHRDATSKAEKEWCFHVVETLYKNPRLPSSRVSSLREYLALGPFYAPPKQAEPEVQ